MTGGSVFAEGWLVKSRERGLRFPILKSKWARRYYVLRCQDPQREATYLDEFRSNDKRRLRKSIDLGNCTQVDSHLQLTEASCAARGGLSLQWIFSIHLTRATDGKRIEMYLAAETEEGMIMWVRNLCEVLGLSKQNYEEPGPAASAMPTSVPELVSTMQSFDIDSNGSAPSDISVLRQPAVSQARPNYQHIKNCHSPRRAENMERKDLPSARGHEIGEASSVSSLASSHSVSNTDDESSSTCSGVPRRPPAVPPRRPELTVRPPLHLNGHVPLSAAPFYDENADRESSGETIKLHPLPNPPPPEVNRKNKPSRHQQQAPSHLPVIPPTTPRGHSTTTFGYFEPSEMNVRSRGASARRPPDYMTIDKQLTQVARTLATMNLYNLRLCGGRLMPFSLRANGRAHRIAQRTEDDLLQHGTHHLSVAHYFR